MFVRRLVSGVRSSCEASWTSCCCRLAASSSASSIALKVEASWLSSSLPSTSIRWRQVAGRADPLGRLAQLAHRQQGGARDEEAGAGGERDPAQRDEEEPEPDLRELVVDARRADATTCDRDARLVRDGDRRGSRDVLARRTGRVVEDAPGGAGGDARAPATTGSSGVELVEAPGT